MDTDSLLVLQSKIGFIFSIILGIISLSKYSLFLYLEYIFSIDSNDFLHNASLWLFFGSNWIYDKSKFIKYLISLFSELLINSSINSYNSFSTLKTFCGLFITILPSVNEIG